MLPKFVSNSALMNNEWRNQSAERTISVLLLKFRNLRYLGSFVVDIATFLHYFNINICVLLYLLLNYSVHLKAVLTTVHVHVFSKKQRFWIIEFFCKIKLLWSCVEYIKKMLFFLFDCMYRYIKNTTGNGVRNWYARVLVILIENNN